MVDLELTKDRQNLHYGRAENLIDIKNIFFNFECF